jgi:soluble lytic murein transglycosylase-like protein
MRGAPQTLPRLNAVSAFLAAAALLAFSAVNATVASAKPHPMGLGTGSTSSSADSEEAYAIPRNAPSGDVEIVLPQPLPPSAVAQYQRIFAMQEEGAFTEADRLIARLNDTTLVGPILAQRYLTTNYRASSAELLSWYENYNDEPAAAAIYALMQKKLPRASLPLAPQFSLLPDATATSFAGPKPAIRFDNPAWQTDFAEGLSDWRNGDIQGAAPLFLRAANNSFASDDDQAAGAFWAARAALRLQEPQTYLNLLRQAAQFNSTFYGMIAGRLLGEGFGPTGIAATLTEADITAVDATPEGHLAFALLQVGENEQAGLALRALWPDLQADPALAHSVMAVAARAGLVDVAIALAGQVPDATGNDIASARLPLPPLHPNGGFQIDPALLYALARTESGFNANAVSPCGARGLMQLMPVTAEFIARNQGISAAVGDPSANLALGQAYVRYLGEQNGINDNLLAILASYNAGPNAAAAWYGQLQGDSDPLVFLETIPNDETRRFIHQVLADSWIYAEEIGLRPASLDDLAQGNFPMLRNMQAVAAAN